MAYFQKTIVRYERNPRAAEDADFWEKWQCPCFLGTDDDCYRPLVLENNNGERIWIHIPYTKWVSWTSLQKK